jgi:hypothetical protein
VADSLDAQKQVAVDSLRRVLDRLGTSPDPTKLIGLMPQLRPLFQGARDAVAHSVTEVHSILRDDQWDKVPADLRNFQATPNFRGGFRRPGGPD